MSDSFRLVSETTHIENSEETIYSLFIERGWSDGLPIIAPTEQRVLRMLSLLGNKDPQEVVAILPPRLGAATLEKIAINDANITSVEAEEDQSLKLTMVSNGSETSKVFDLVVLITQPQLSNEVKKMSRGLDLSLNYANFLADGEGSVLLTTDKETIQLAAKG